MPWPYAMAVWCQDTVATALTGKLQFRRPYPRDDWLEDRRWNAFPLAAIDAVLEAEAVFKIPPGKWGGEERAYYRQLQKDLRE